VTDAIADASTDEAPPSAGLGDVRNFLRIPRIGGLVLSPDGRRLGTAVTTLDEAKMRWVTSVWEVDPEGERPSRRLTRSAAGESTPAFLPNGDLLFTSTREGGSQSGDDDVPEGERTPALWLLPAGGGEARLLLRTPGGVIGLAVARDAGDVIAVVPMTPGVVNVKDDKEHRAARAKAGVSGLLHLSYPVRYWDHDLGPGEPRLLRLRAPADLGEDDSLEPDDLTPAPGRALDEQQIGVAPDGSSVVTGWTRPLEHGERRTDLVAVDAATGERRVLVEQDGSDNYAPRVSPDGRTVAFVREVHSSLDEPTWLELWVVGVDGSAPRQLTEGTGLWPADFVWTADSSALMVVADEGGRRPLFRLDVSDGALTRLTAEGAYSDPCPSPDGQHVYALRSGIDRPAAPVRLDATAADQQPTPLLGPVHPPELAGRLEEVTANAEDGTPLRAWLALPEGASAESPAPLLLWMHGGPLSSWNDWSWRWSPWLMVARGYAVLLPDPALSTGYGIGMIRRGWGRWGGEPYTDLMAVTDEALQRPDLDSARTAAMGGSFGGYLANWVAGQTDRFRAIVTHASLWALDAFGGATDAAHFWQRDFGDPLTQPERYEKNSPHQHAASIRTPMLVVHGDRDYRVPIGEGLRLWWDLTRHDVEAQFLYFPDENHWVLRPGNSVVWYDTVLAFLDHHVLGAEWTRPEHL
jgi:dipeptidyl aminopeptidase/acylaminoacyl peptidase